MESRGVNRSRWHKSTNANESVVATLGEDCVGTVKMTASTPGSCRIDAILIPIRIQILRVMIKCLGVLCAPDSEMDHMSDALDPDDYPPPVHSIAVPLPGGRRVLVEFIQHAVDRMAERGVSEVEVVACLRTPDRRGLEADPPKTRVCRCDGNAPSRSLHVVYIPFNADHWRVFSVYWQRTGA